MQEVKGEGGNLRARCRSDPFLVDKKAPGELTGLLSGRKRGGGGGTGRVVAIAATRTVHAYDAVVRVCRQEKKKKGNKPPPTSPYGNVKKCSASTLR